MKRCVLCSFAGVFASFSPLSPFSPSPGRKPQTSPSRWASCCWISPTLPNSRPLDVYHHVPAEKLKVFIISDTDQERVTYEGMPFRANYTIDNAPKLDVLVVPSGAGSLDADLKNVRVIDWVQKVAREAKFITSHCQGAFLLAQAGCSRARK